MEWEVFFMGKCREEEQEAADASPPTIEVK